MANNPPKLCPTSTKLRSGYFFMISLTDFIDDSNALSNEEKSKSISEYSIDFSSSFGTIMCQK